MSSRKKLFNLRRYVLPLFGGHDSRKSIWHDHFVPSLVAGVVIGVIVYFYDTTVANILFFASVGSSAVILSNSTSHHLVKLRTTMIAYGLLILLAPLIQLVIRYVGLHEAVTIGVLVFSVSVAMFWLNAFHPPAISAAVAFIFFEGSLLDLVYLFLLVMLVFTAIRFLMYVSYQHLSPRQFWNEFKHAVYE